MVNSKDKESYIRFLEDKNELWTDRLLINQWVSSGDSLKAELELADYPSATEEQAKYKEVMTTINRSRNSKVSAKTQGFFNLTAAVANDPSDKMQSVAQSGLAANWGAAFQRHAPKRNYFSSVSHVAQPDIYCAPNPAQLSTVVKANAGTVIEAHDKVQIYDVHGNLWYETMVKDCVWNEGTLQVDLSRLENGIYLVSLLGKARPTKLIISK